MGSSVLVVTCAVLCCAWSLNRVRLRSCWALLSMGSLQARIVEWVGMTSSRGSYWPRDWTRISCIAVGKIAGEGTGYPLQYFGASLVAQQVKNLPEMFKVICDGWWINLVASPLRYEAPPLPKSLGPPFLSPQAWVPRVFKSAWLGSRVQKRNYIAQKSVLGGSGENWASRDHKSGVSCVVFPDFWRPRRVSFKRACLALSDFPD